MPQRDPDRAVADATGEITSAVRRRGLVVIDPRHDSIDPEGWTLKVSRGARASIR